MNYQEALEALEGALKFGINPSLEPIRLMCQAMGNPQQAYQCVQIAGTNGKSSTTRLIAGLLGSQGKSVGLYTSPELVRYPERMEINGMVVSDQDFADAVEAALKAAADCGLEVTEFELLTAGAFWLFAREGVEYAVLECGLGGRWDATSVCSPAVSVITGIGLDHTHILGNTIEEIAAEKAAIIKEGSTAVLAMNLAGRQVFVDQAKSVGALAVDVRPALAEELAPAVAHMPAFQKYNAATAFTAVEQLFATRLEVMDAIMAWKNLQIPGRFETLRTEPLLMIDASHNPQSSQVLASEIVRRFPEREGRPVLLLGVLADKDARGIIQALVPLFDRIVVTASTSPRRIEPNDLAVMVREETGVEPEVCASIAEALELLKDVPVLSTGSITVAGETKGEFLGII